MCIRQRIEGSNPSLTAIFKERACTQVRAFLFYIAPTREGGEASTRVRIPPSPPYSKKEPVRKYGLFCFISLRPGREEKPRPGFDHWRSQGDSLRATRADCPQGEAQRAESIPPSPPYLKKEPVREYGLFCFYIAPGKRQVRSAYLPYKTFRRVGKRKRTHHSPALAGALRLPALQNLP